MIVFLKISKSIWLKGMYIFIFVFLLLLILHILRLVFIYKLYFSLITKVKLHVGMECTIQIFYGLYCIFRN